MITNHRNLEWCKRKKCRSRQELSDEYLLAKFGFDTAENYPPKGSKKCMLARVGWRDAGAPRAAGAGDGGRDLARAPRPDLLRRQRRGGDVRERRLAKFRQNVARFRLYRHRFLQVNMRFAAFFKIYRIIKLTFLKFGNILQISQNLQDFAEFSRKLLIFQTDFLRKF